MRHILVNYAEQQKASKRGGDALRVTLESLELITETPAEELLTLHQALAELEADHPRRAQVVECRVFGGMSVEETAGALDISTATVKREWRVSSTWLYRALRDADDGRAPTSP
jgi:RNA polymerase sigma factor (TIGR02999 family)